MTSTEERKPRSAPAWMSVGGAPPRPQNNKFREEKDKLIEKRKHLIETVKGLQDKIKASKLSREEDPEAESWKIELDRIDEENAIEKAKRTKKNEEAAAVKAERQELANKAKDTARELKCFNTLQEIDAAIDLLMRRMETSGKSSSASSRQTEKQIRELRRVRPLILVRRGQDEQVEKLKEREDNLKQESFEINERIKVLTQQRDAVMKKKQAHSGKNREAAEERSAIFKEITEVRAQITEVNEELDRLFDENRKANAAYDDWCTEAKTKYAKQQEERRREQEEKYHSAKKEEKLNRASQRQNPYKVQIAACDTLAQYLKDRKLMTEREEKQRRMKEEAKHFDPSSSAPEGYVVLNEGKWNNATTAPGGKKKKGQQQQTGQPKKAAAAPTVRLLQHSEDKMKLFQLVGLEPVMSLDAVDASIVELAKKKKEFENHIKSGEVVLSSDHDDEDEEGEHADSKTNGAEEGHEEEKKDDGAAETTEAPVPAKEVEVEEQEKDEKEEEKVEEATEKEDETRAAEKEETLEAKNEE